MPFWAEAVWPRGFHHFIVYVAPFCLDALQWCEVVSLKIWDISLKYMLIILASYKKHRTYSSPNILFERLLTTKFDMTTIAIS